MRKNIKIFGLGGLSFVVSQLLLRIPILNYIQKKTYFIEIYTMFPLFIGILIAFSAGLFEESFRFIFKRFLIKSRKTKLLDPILFGLGHGLIEAIIVLGPYLFTVPFGNLALGFIERILAIIMHIGLSVIIWNGFILNKRYTYLGIAILIHGLVNSLIPILSNRSNQIILIEGLLLVVDIFIVFYIFKSKKYYYKEEKK